MLELSIGSNLEILVLKNDANCTSQRLKLTSAGRVMIIVDACTVAIVRPSLLKRKASALVVLKPAMTLSGLLYGHRTSLHEVKKVAFEFEQFACSSDQSKRVAGRFRKLLGRLRRQYTTVCASSQAQSTSRYGAA